ncbi:MAG: DUF4259 domain-containing protein [Arenicella sp.]
MGAWSEENFGNDDACDWVWVLEKSKGVDILLSPLKVILANNEYLESPECCEALAAAEVIASAITGDDSRIPEEAQKWLAKKQGFFGKKPQIKKEHALIAKQAIEKILDNSELKELWEETEEYSKWCEIQTQLIATLADV